MCYLVFYDFLQNRARYCTVLHDLLFLFRRHNHIEHLFNTALNLDLNLLDLNALISDSLKVTKMLNNFLFNLVFKRLSILRNLNSHLDKGFLQDGNPLISSF